MTWPPSEQTVTQPEKMLIVKELGQFDLPKKLSNELYAVRVAVNAPKGNRDGSNWIFEGIGITRVIDLP